MIIFTILITLLILLFTGLPIFAGLTIYGGALLLLTQGNFGSVSDIIFHEVNRYLLVAIPLFGFMANIMIKGRVVMTCTTPLIPLPVTCREGWRWRRSLPARSLPRFRAVASRQR